MPNAIQRRRGSTAQHAVFTGLLGEITVDTDKKVVVVHDGITPGGTPMARAGVNNDINALPNLNSINGGQLAGFRNRIINGAFTIDERSLGGALTPTGSLYTTDRWLYSTSQASKITLQTVADAPAGFVNSTKISVAAQFSPAATDSFQFIQGIEASNTSDFQFGLATAQSLALSFWVKGSVAGTYSVCFRNNAGSRSYVATFTVTTSWAKVTLPIPGDIAGAWVAGSTTATGLSVSFDLGSGSNFNTTAGVWTAGNWFRAPGSVAFVSQVNASTLNITGVQIEIGTVSTPFEQRTYAMELALCKRYFVRIPSFIVSGYGSAGQGQYVDVPISPPMRTAPTSTFLAPNYSNMSGASVLSASASAARLFATFVSTGNGYADIQQIGLAAEL